MGLDEEPADQSRGMSTVRECRLRRALPADCGVLTALAMRSKAHWGHDAEFMAAAREELTVTAECLDREIVRLAEREGVPVGFYRLATEGQEAEIEAFFVAPERIGMGTGRQLWADMMAHLRDTGASRLICQSDPGAEGFYRAMGMVPVGTRESASVPGRFLPLLELELAAEGNR